MNLFDFHDDDPVPFVGARNTDPDTSHMAADQIRERHGEDLRNFTRRNQKWPLLNAYAALLDATDDEAHELAGIVSKCPWKRCSELRQVGFITRVNERVDPKTKATVMVCQITPAGIEKLRELLGGDT